MTSVDSPFSVRRMFLEFIPCKLMRNLSEISVTLLSLMVWIESRQFKIYFNI